jgi:succinoglycan biosynthesis transport protein ExoP
VSEYAPTLRDARIDVAAVLAVVGRRLPRISIITLLVLAATFLVLTMMPRLYESSASILVEPRSNIYSRATNEQPASAAGDTSVVSSQIELIKSRDTLMGVIDRLDLRSRSEFNGAQSGFSPLGVIMQLIGRSATPVSIDERVINTLYERMTVIQQRDSRIISILVRSTDPQLAADIANAVAAAHVARRAQLSLSDTAEASGWLSQEIDRLRVVVSDAEAAVAKYRVDNDLYIGANNTTLLDQQLSTVSAQITAAQERKNTAQSRAAVIRGLLQRGQPIENVADVRNSPAFQQLQQERSRLQGELAQLSTTFLPAHPRIRALNSQIAELSSRIGQEGNRVAQALEAEAQVEADIEASLQADLARAKLTASDATRDTVALDSLQREAKAQRDLLEAYLLRFNEASSRVDPNSALPDVRVVTEAAPAVTPAFPKTALILAGVGIVTFAIQFGAVVFGELMSGRALRPVEPLSRQPAPEAPPVVLAEAPELKTAVEPEPALAAEPPPPALGRAEAPAFVAPVAPGSADVSVASESARRLLRELSERRAQRAAIQAAKPVADTTEDIAPEAIDLEDTITVVPQVAEAPREIVGMVRYDDLVADLVLGNTHLVLLADHADDRSGRKMADTLVADALGKGLSAVLVDGGSNEISHNPGLSDLSAGAAGFGDVVRKSVDQSFAEVSWGTLDSIDRSSTKPSTLIEALGDIYEVVVVMTGKVGPRSTLPVFADLGGRVVLVMGGDQDASELESLREQLLEAGLPNVEITPLDDAVAA